MVSLCHQFNIDTYLLKLIDLHSHADTMYVLWVWWSLCKRFHGQFTETPEDKEGVLLQDVAEHPLGHLLPLLANPLPILSIQLVQGCNHNVIKLDLCMVDAKTYLLPSCVIQVMYGLARDSIYICIY